MLDLLAATRARLGPAPRRFQPAVLSGLVGVPPQWIGSNDPLREAEGDRRFLLQNGHLVLGWVVMANSQLFEPIAGPPAPGLVVYSASPETEPELLREVATAVFDLRKAKPVDAEVASIARAIAEDVFRVMGERVPSGLSQGHDLWLTTFVIRREHLPQPRLAASLLPVLVHPDKKSVALLPLSLWADDLRTAWIDLGGME